MTVGNNKISCSVSYLNTELAGLVFQRVSMMKHRAMGWRTFPPHPCLNGGRMEEKGGLWWEKMSSQVSLIIFLNGTCTGEPPARLKWRFQGVFKL